MFSSASILIYRLPSIIASISAQVTLDSFAPVAAYSRQVRISAGVMCEYIRMISASLRPPSSNSMISSTEIRVFFIVGFPARINGSVTMRSYQIGFFSVLAIAYLLFCPWVSSIPLPEVFKKAPGDKDSIFSYACFVNALFSSTKAYRTLYFLDKKGDRDREAIWILLVQVGDTLYNDGQSTRQKNWFDIHHLQVNLGRILDHIRKHSPEAYARIIKKE